MFRSIPPGDHVPPDEQHSMSSRNGVALRPDRHWELLHAAHPRAEALLREAASPRACPAGFVMYRSGEHATAVYLVQTGRFEVVRTHPSGQAISLELPGPGEVFGERALLGQSREHLDTAMAMLPSSVLAIAQHVFDQVRRDEPGLDQFLIALFSQRCDELVGEATQLAHASAEERIVHRLRQLTGQGTINHHANNHGANNHGAAGEPTPGEVAVRITQEQLARSVGSTRETANRALRDLAARGVIRLERHQITLIDMTQLSHSVLHR